MSFTNQDNDNPAVLITGGSGFLGQAIVEELLDPRSPVIPREIRILDLKDYSGRPDNRIKFIRGNICNYEDVLEATRSTGLVIHSAAVVDWGTKKAEDVYQVNFEGTRNVVNACIENNVPNLVYTSSLDTVISGKPLVNIDESQPYPEKHPNMYCESKCLAEKFVISSSNENLKTCVIRPSDIYGEGDPYHLPPLINMAKGGLYIRIGNGKARSQHVYVRNVAWAHLLAANALLENNQAVTGNAYFITDGPGSNFFSFFDPLVEKSGYKIRPENLWLPQGLAHFMGAVSEYVALLIRPVKYYNPKLSRFAVMYTCTDFTFTADNAKRDFGFTLKYTQAEAAENTIRYFCKKTLG